MTAPTIDGLDATDTVVMLRCRVFGALDAFGRAWTAEYPLDAVRALDNNKDMPAETLRIVYGKLASAIDTLDAVRIHRRDHSAAMRTTLIEAALEMYHEAAALLGVGL